jgi:glycosyltransferase involved in cell wall biosynthesis
VKVSIGLPVFNGENYLSAALASILGQTFSDFELIVCDNASTDGTEDICRAFQKLDTRIDYHRSSVNRGAAPNYNTAFRLSSAAYFKWAAHDDEMDPSYIERCVAVLDADPGAVLCHSLVALIDCEGRTLDVHDSRLTGADSSSAASRFSAVALLPHQATELDGVIRTDALRRTALVGAFPGSDRALLAELALLGGFRQIREPLFMTREHPGRYRRAATRPEDRWRFFDTASSQRKTVPTWTLYSDYLRMVKQHVADPPERRRIRHHLLRWWFTNWNWARILVDLIAVVAPGALWHAERIKQRVFSPEPGPSIQGGKRKLPVD